MQLKTIKSIITKKLEDWLETIQDEKLRKELRNNILVSGGSIASMLLSEDVNDYDIYIKDMDVLKRLTQYYVKPFSAITVFDGRIKDKLLQEQKGEERETAYNISVNNLKEDQIKLFFSDATKGGFATGMEVKEATYKPLYFSPNAITLSDKIQIVIRFHGDSTKIHETFDFIHATNYFTFEEGLVTNKQALESLLTKQLMYQGSLYPLTSIIRMKKFIIRKWKISAGEILKIMFQIAELDLTNPNVLEEQLVGVDVAYFSMLIEILREVDSKKITSKYLNKIIDRVFNGSDETI